MEILPGLLALQLVATGAGFVWLWRRQRRLSGEVTRLRAALLKLEERGAVAPRRARRAEPGTVVPLTVDDAPASPSARAALAWKLESDEIERASAAPALSPDTTRGLVLALMATSPAFGLFFGASEFAMASSGLAVAAAMMLIALRPAWRAAAWAAVLTAAAWGVIGFVRGAVHAEPLSYSVCAALAAAAGLVYARQREPLPGAALALAMGAAALTLAGQTDMIGPAGVAFALIVAAAALVGATNLRLESVHLASFVGALIGLFVLSGQDSAAIWFTPAAAWVGALYFAIAVVRAPQLGARGATLAGTGALAPFAAIAALHAAQHGLGDRFAAAGAFAVLAALLGGLIALSALRNQRGLAALRLALWILALGAFASAASAIMLAAPAPLAASGLAALGLGLVAVNLRFPDVVWRTFACAAGVLAALFAFVSAELLLAEATQWPPYVAIAIGLFLPALISAAAMAGAAHARAHATAGFFEALAIVLCVGLANLVTRLVFSGGATLLEPIGLVEAGVHVGVWLAAAMLIGSQPRREERPVSGAAAHVLSVLGLAGVIAASVQWMVSYWAAAPASPPADEPLGFLLPGILFLAHWVFWRARGAEAQTRVAFAAGALLLAAAVTLHTMRTENVPDWLEALVGALSFALAIGVNFAPGVAAAEGPRALDFEENLDGHRRRHQRRQHR